MPVYGCWHEGTLGTVNRTLYLAGGVIGLAGARNQLQDSRQASRNS